MNWNKVWLWVTAIVLVALEFYSFTTNSHYKWDFFFLVFLLVGVYILKDKIKLHPLHYFFFCLFLIMHNLGTFGTYKMFPLGMEYDFWVHGFFGFVASLMLYRTYHSVGPYKSRKFMYVAIIAIVLGFSAFHELFEYAGAVTLGEGGGVLFIGAGDVDEWDTQKDMRNNLFGAILGLLLYGGFDGVAIRRGNRKK